MIDIALLVKIIKTLQNFIYKHNGDLKNVQRYYKQGRIERMSSPYWWKALSILLSWQLNECCAATKKCNCKIGTNKEMQLEKGEKIRS